MMDQTEKLLWNYAEAAGQLSLTEQALRDLVYKGRGPHVTRIGRRALFRPSDVEAWVDMMAHSTRA